MYEKADPGAQLIDVVMIKRVSCSRRNETQLLKKAFQY